jgi:prepilin-type N-terminal cleavage/methylation domain-containing protein
MAQEVMGEFISAGKMQKLLKQKNRGFTIVESLVAIAILVAAVIGATSAVQSGISSYIFSKDQITAFYLAQEGLEQLRNLRDENHLNDNGWLHGIAENSSDPCYFGEACTVSPIETSSLIHCSGVGSCAYLREDDDTGFFGYNASWSTTKFRRQIVLTSVNANEVSAEVTVSWAKGLINRSFVARENILNWQ